MSEETKQTVEKVEEEAAAETKAEPTVEELKAEAERLEAELKEEKSKGKEKDDELRQNMQRRIDKANEKLAKVRNQQSQEGVLDTEDLITLRMKGISKDSEQAKVLEKYRKGGLISSYEEGLVHPGVKAELEAIIARETAETVIDENADEETRVRTDREVVEDYRRTGKVPSDQGKQKAIVDANLKSMGL